MNSGTYRAAISREDPWWVATVEGVGATESKTIAGLEDMVRDLIVFIRDLDKSGFNLIWDYELPDDAAGAGHETRQAITRIHPGNTGPSCPRPAADPVAAGREHRSWPCRPSNRVVRLAADDQAPGYVWPADRQRPGAELSAIPGCSGAKAATPRI